MELLKEIKFYEKNNKLPAHCIREAIYNSGLFIDETTLEETDNNSAQRVDVLNKINNDNFIKNNYQSFSEELSKNKRSSFLTQYTPDELKNNNVQTFQVPNYEIGFGFKPLPNGDVDIIGVHNNTNIGGIGEALIDAAIRAGGTTLDHYDGFLSDFYNKKGFNEYERWTWDDNYAPKYWDYEKYGRPDVVLRRLKK